MSEPFPGPGPVRAESPTPSGPFTIALNPPSRLGSEVVGDCCEVKDC